MVAIKKAVAVNREKGTALPTYNEKPIELEISNPQLSLMSLDPPIVSSGTDTEAVQSNAAISEVIP